MAKRGYSKYRNVRVKYDGYTFDSKKERDRYIQLKAMEKAGEISDLRRQVTYPLAVNGVKICSIRPDFEYVRNGELVTEDVKSTATANLPLFKVKARLFEAIYGRPILVFLGGDKPPKPSARLLKSQDR